MVLLLSFHIEFGVIKGQNTKLFKLHRESLFYNFRCVTCDISVTSDINNIKVFVNTYLLLNIKPSVWFMHSENACLFNRLVFDKKYLILKKIFRLCFVLNLQITKIFYLLVFFFFSTTRNILTSKNAALLTRPPNLRLGYMLSCPTSTA